MMNRQSKIADGASVTHRRKKEPKGLSSLTLALIALIALSFSVYLGKSYENLLRGIDSNIHAKASMDVTADVNLTNVNSKAKGTPGLPRLPIPNTNSTLTDTDGTYFNDHPFFYFWLNGRVMRALEPSAWSARVLTATFSVGCVLLTFLLGMQLHSQLFGFLSALFFLFARDMVLTGATVSLDPAMMFFILASFVFWNRQNWMGMSISVGVGLWIKTPVVLLIYPTAFIVSLARGKLEKDFKPLVCSFAFSALIGSVIWIITGLLGGWSLVQDYWIRQVWGTAIQGRNVSFQLDHWSSLKMLRTGFLPSLIFLLLGVGRGLQFILQKIQRRISRKSKLPILRWEDIESEPAFLISTVAILVTVLAITPIRFRMDYYFNPIFPFLALLSSYSIIDWVKSHEERIYQAFTALTCLLIAFLLCTPTRLGPETFVALKRFIPLIQSYGTCQDEVLLIAGGEPVGSSHDYALVLNFYTGHVVEQETCPAAAVSLRKDRPHWVILSKDHLEQCLTAEDKARYSSRFRVGNQYLLTDLIQKEQPTDLSFLERELQPSVDCHPPEYPNDIYHTGF